MEFNKDTSLKGLSDAQKRLLYDKIKDSYEKTVKKEVESVPCDIWVYFVSGRIMCFEGARFFLPCGAMDDMVYIREKNGATTYLMMQHVERLTYMEVEKSDDQNN